MIYVENGTLSSSEIEGLRAALSVVPREPNTPAAGAQLRAFREAQGLSKVALAAMLGCHRASIWAFEAGRGAPDRRIALAIARQTGIPVSAWESCS